MKDIIKDTDAQPDEKYIGWRSGRVPVWELLSLWVEVHHLSRTWMHSLTQKRIKACCPIIFAECHLLSTFLPRISRWVKNFQPSLQLVFLVPSPIWGLSMGLTVSHLNDKNSGMIKMESLDTTKDISITQEISRVSSSLGQEPEAKTKYISYKYHSWHFYSMESQEKTLNYIPVLKSKVSLVG